MTSGVKPRIVNRLEDMHIPDEARKFAEQAIREMRDVSPEEFLGTMPEKIPPIPFVSAECRYEIGEGADRVVYIQRKPKLMQIKQLLKMLQHSDIDFGDVDLTPSREGLDQIVGLLTKMGVNGVLSVLGDGIPAALAILLTPEGVRLQDKNLLEIQEHLELCLDPDQGVEIAADFFDYVKAVRAKAERKLAERSLRLKAQAASHKT